MACRVPVLVLIPRSDLDQWYETVELAMSVCGCVCVFECQYSTANLLSSRDGPVALLVDIYCEVL